MKVTGLSQLLFVASLIMARSLSSDAGLEEDKKLANKVNLDKDKLTTNASLEENNKQSNIEGKKSAKNAVLEQEKLIRRQRSLEGDFLQVTDDGYGFQLPVNPEIIFNGVFDINNIMIHVSQNLVNAFSSFISWTIIAFIKIVFTNEPTYTFDLSDQARHKRSAKDMGGFFTDFQVSGDGTSVTLPFNPAAVYNGVLQINNLIIHATQNLLNGAASSIMWTILAIADIIFGDKHGFPFGFSQEDFKVASDEYGFNPKTINVGVLTRNNVLIHHFQNLINYIGNLLGWVIIALFIV